MSFHLSASLSVTPASVSISYSRSPLSNPFDKHSHCHWARPWLCFGKEAMCRPLPPGPECSLPFSGYPRPRCILTGPAPPVQELQDLLLQVKGRVHIPATP